MRFQLPVLHLLTFDWSKSTIKPPSTQIVLDAGSGSSNDHIINLTQGCYVGTKLSNGVSQWLGIPYAASPVGDLRFAPPTDPPVKNGLQDASTQGPLCISTGSGTIPADQSEDCLYLAVYAPTSATPSSRLPVFVFIQGGGFNANANPNLNGTGLIEASSHSIIVVTFNYRVGPWGFLATPTSASGLPTANNGLRDQRKVLEWVQKYISAFGGDSGHVVIGGDSAGAASIALHLAAHGGRDDNLFHGVAAESVSFATILTTSESQYQYDTFATAAGCSLGNSTDSLKCLRSKTAAELEAHNYNIPYPGQNRPPLYMFNPTLDGDFITDLTYTAFERGLFIKVPVIFGDDTNGGTVFTPHNTASQKDSDEFLTSNFPYLTTSQLTEISKFYPKPNHDCPADGCWWRQISNAYGELRYMCPGLYISSAFANTSLTHTFDHGTCSSDYQPKTTRNDAPYNRACKSWAYRYNVEDPDQMAQGLGVPHIAEINAIFGPDNVPAGSAPASYYKFKSNENIVPIMQAYWTSFIRTFDPNTHKLEWSARWDSYYNRQDQPQRLVFQNAGATQMEIIDAEQRKRCDYLQSIGPLIKQKVK